MSTNSITSSNVYMQTLLHYAPLILTISKNIWIRPLQTLTSSPVSSPSCWPHAREPPGYRRPPPRIWWLRSFRPSCKSEPPRFLMALSPPAWSQAHQAYMISLGRRTTGIQWMSRIIRRIWQIAWDLWIHRRSVLESTDAAILPAIHISLNMDIDFAFQTYRGLPNPLPSISRWFARDPIHLHKESVDWKRRWLEMVNSATQDP